MLPIDIDVDVCVIFTSHTDSRRIKLLLLLLLLFVYKTINTNIVRNSSTILTIQYIYIYISYIYLVCDTSELWCGASGLCARVRACACAGAAESFPLHTYTHIPPIQEPVALRLVLINIFAAPDIRYVSGVSRLTLDPRSIPRYLVIFFVHVRYLCV